MDMKKLTVVAFSAVLLLAGLNAALAEDQTVYVAFGEKLSLGPSFSAAISSLLWKHDGNMVVEWVKDKIDKTYGNFVDRTNLDKTTGRLEIMNMTAADAGAYTIEINKKDQGLRYNVNVIKRVPQPVVAFKPLACSSTDTCKLSCDGETEGAEPVDYFWKFGDGDWKMMEKTMSVTRAGNPRDKTFTCYMKNPVSEKESKPEDNPFYTGDGDGDGDGDGNGGAIAGGVIGVLILIAIGLVVYRKRDAIKKKFGINGSDVRDGEAGTGQSVNLADTGKNAKEDGAPATENGEKSPSVDSTGPGETEPLATSAVP